jgi:magnesium/cobalt transport protein CorA
VATALLFDRDEVETLEDWDEGLPRLHRSAVLWIDLERPREDELERLGHVLDLGTRGSLAKRPTAPSFRDYGTHLEVTACAPTTETKIALVTCLVSERWVVTLHDEPLEVLETFRELASGSGSIGTLDGPEFLATLLEWVFESYFDAFERIEETLEEIDAQSMSGTVESHDAVIERLVETRREIGRLRRALTGHREAILALSRPEVEAIASSSSAERYAALRDRLDEGVQAARDAREAVVGAFDVLIAGTGQRTNEIMKILTLASVLILPGTLIAGVMGMNFRLGLFDQPAYFWVVLALMLLLAVLTVTVARVRDWI